MNRIIFLGLLFLVFFSCKKEKRVCTILTNDSVALWDITFYEESYKNDSIYLKRTRSISFHNNFDCFTYSKLRTGERIIDVIGPKKNYLGLCSKWELINDSLIFLNCKNKFTVRIINRSEEHTSELQSRENLVCRLLLEKKKRTKAKLIG